MQITFIGVGRVGAPLADHLQQLGHTVTIAARNPASQSVQKALALNPHFQVRSPLEAVQAADVVFLAPPYEAVSTALLGLESALAGKVLVDCTNPVADDVSHGLQSQISGSETVQQLVPEAYVVKAFTIYGFKNFEDNTYPGYGDLKPAMLIAGNDRSAKAIVANLCTELGWEAVDTGPLSNSLHLEHMTLLWIKMAFQTGYGPGFVWAMLRR